MSIPEQFGDSFDFCVLFRVYFTGKGAHRTKLGMQMHHQTVRETLCGVVLIVFLSHYTIDYEKKQIIFAVFNQLSSERERITMSISLFSSS